MNSEGKARLIVITGGARSGKSTFAERLADRSGKRVAMVATALASDDDMRERIARHRAVRPAAWQTVEEPLRIGWAIQKAAESADVLLLDCITTWLGNWLFMRPGEGAVDEAATSAHYYDEVLEAIQGLLDIVDHLPTHKTVLVVTNEVGWGIVPAYALGRVYRDMLGVVNQRLAQAATHVYLMVAGIGVDVKRLEEEITL